ncbi:arginine repressor [Garciella nitratireducens]|uniref:Arginine repressor n=1 Tax=Garciella nitratireducens DSM 15102 TaxID=1121911 RepID=A0A1T4K3K7_9FIRM|nr:arginine repressor [Garciella nitratireducens]RBP46649.1 ArgR family transcriptional regulator [Garciella nitratireducens]SJZ36933.1 transcriptional regulator, ArgR family [Garciella nitratireducens DSM 15102]
MKLSRHAMILDIIEKNEVETQEELAELLKQKGINVTQATISRDIKELKLIKVMSRNGKYRYAPFKKTETNINDRIVNVFRESVVNIDYAGNIIVIKTLSGTAMGASVAIDALGWTEIVGCVAGDDTIFVLIKSQDVIEEIVKRFNRLTK